ncbi:T9SS type A sorting domain-containing protein [Ignavibacterium sp.]|uniref:T9SS type A sorting domain-containing protein n=1 Tax=Ignavibacterium sp. TaxID=2651167 RepID=UPI0021FC4D17|nr:T9SS type A sorting domain-containing protein [Ignavibacterium sp.]BDQ02953.1 MAG: hypothetical protein KatS3mg037_1528 [Ignavibacterium sp.]
MKNIMITLLLITLLSILNYPQNTYSIQPGVKNNQIILELKNISETEQTSLPKPLLRRGFKHIKFYDNTEEQIVLNPEETKEIVYNFDIDYNIGNVIADTLEFMITDNKSVYLTKQFILQYVLPTEFTLDQNYPNPFNPRTKIRFTIPDVGSELAQTVIKVYDILGNEVTTLVNEQKEPGYYEVEFNAERLSSGVYFYRLQAGNFTQTKKMILMR